MLTLLPGFCLVLVYAYKLGLLTNPGFLLNVIFAFLISLISIVEGIAITPDFFYVRLDEYWFYRESVSGMDYILNNHFRYFLYLAYSNLSYILGGEYIFKFHLVPFALLTSLVLFDITRLKSVLYFFTVVFGYIYFLSTIHMRDTLIVFFCLFFLFKLAETKKPAFVIFVTILFFLTLRAEFIIVFLFTYFWMKSESIFKKGFLLNYFIPGFLIIVLISLPNFTDIVVVVSDLFFPGRMGLYLALRSEEVSSLPFLTENASSIIRQLITPFPWSKIRSLLTEPMGLNLYVKEIFRVIMMSSYFLMILYLFFNLKKVVEIMDENKFLRLLFAVSIQITILYAIFGDGGGASRNKLFPIILVFLIFNYSINHKKTFKLKEFYENP
jgi:hypothetical protein